ncbi:Major facilitator superfamily domain general substrate transporter [Penicillium verhagenii]|uniref:Major facilitator superfamily domain general substrate transporter n=1 Tax=Penicillium verhagenii TaxID=1562060 RepID=UPI00254533EF|nr:Major facilitator superfamily domain general substrate transporter [Penicillium verhagenii]KAJ5919360.1 Major facilitator superfamily domain general substrate transporter [Penicillium verhagenii]
MVKEPQKNDKCSTLSDISESSNDNHATLDARNETLERKSLSVSGSLQDLQGAHPIMSCVRSQVPGQERHIALPFLHVKTGDDMIVDFDGPEDPYQPMNWRFSKKLVTTILYGFTAMGAPWASSIYSTGQTQVSEEFHVSTEVSTLGTSLLLFGLGLGPLVWAPLSEVYGRKPAVLAPYFLAAVFSFATATAKDVQTIMLTRFFAGFFGSAPVTNTGGVLGDIWPPEQRGAALVAYSIAVFGGPVLGPIVGGAISESYLGWRWTEYITGILMMICLILDLVFIDETYPPILLTRKARRLRLETGNWALHARHEEWNASYRDFGKKYLIRPFQLLATPICFLVALYASFVYAILYLSLAAFPIVFQEIRGWNQVVGALPFISYFIGIMIGALVNLSNQKFYVKRMKENNNRPVPEARLPPMMLGSVCFAGGLFMFGWTSPAHIHWIAPNIGAVLMGIGILTILQPALNYLIDTFHSTAASAVAASTFLRSIFAGSFPLFTDAMFHNLGVPWAASVLGFISVALLPIPYLFYIYGRRLRARGKYSKDST